MKRVYDTSKYPTWWWLDYYIDDMIDAGQLPRWPTLEEVNRVLSEHGIQVSMETKRWCVEYEDEKEYFALLLKYS